MTKIRKDQIVDLSLSQFNDDIGATEFEIIKVTDKAQIINQVLDTSKKYSIRQSLVLVDGEFINMDNSPLIEGLGADFTNITTTSSTGVIFKSQTAQNINIKNISLSAVAVGSKVFDLKDEGADISTGTKGSYEFRLGGVNFTGCKDLGIIDGFRQWFTTDLGFYGCSNGFELRGAWNGIFLQNSNLFGFAATGTLFRQGANLSFADRCILQMNINVPTGAKFMDFQPAVFIDDEALQLVDFVAKVDGVKNDANGLLLLPNLSANNPKCLWSGNTGLPNTAIEKIITAANVSGTYTIDWLNDTYDIVMTGNTTFSQINLPASGRRTKTLNITITGNFVPTFPAGWETFKVGTYKGTDQNSIDIKFIAAGKYAMKISNSLSVYPAPDLQSVEPAGMNPNSTSQVILNGSFFTPESLITIQGVQITSKQFINSGKYRLTAVSGSEGIDPPIIISNGTEKTFLNRFSVLAGLITELKQSDTSNANNLIDLSEIGKAKITTFTEKGIFDWFTVPNNENFEIRFQAALGLNPQPSGNTNEYSKIRLIDTSDGIEKVRAANTQSGGINWRSTIEGSRYFNLGNSNSAQTRVENTSPTPVMVLRKTNDGITFRYLSNTGVITAIPVNFLGDVLIRVEAQLIDLVNVKYINLS